MSARAPILVLSNIIVDDLRLADGTYRPGTLGGAAVYAAAGAAFWWPAVGIVTGVGDDLDAVTGNQLGRFGLRREGHLVRDPHTIQSRLVYRADGERTETPAFGKDHFARMQATPDDIPEALLPASGTYIFRDLWPDHWRAFRRKRDQLGTVLWELQGDIAAPAFWREIAGLLPAIDIFSLNHTEGRTLLGTSDPDRIVARLGEAGAGVVVLRLGGEGALIADATTRIRLRPPPSPVIDVTGGGNAFCGGFLAGWCARPGALDHAARCAAASAARAIAGYGPPDPRDRRTIAGLAAATELDQRTLNPREQIST